MKRFVFVTFFLLLFCAYSTAFAQVQTQTNGLNAPTIAPIDELEITKIAPDPINLLVWVNKKCPKPKGGIKSEKSSCFGPNDKECMRVDLLEKILKNIPVNYRIVYDAEHFQQQLRNSYFTDYLILGNHHQLKGRYDEELRELVNSGKGLISSLYLKHCERDLSLFGIKFKGYLPSRHQNINLVSSPITAEGAMTSEGMAARTEALSGAIVAGWIQPDGHDRHWFVNPHHQNCHVGHDPAIVLNDYGQGRSIYYAFDLGATLNDDNYAQIETLVKNSILYTHKPILSSASFLPNQLVPMGVKITSLGGDFDLQIQETYQPPIKIYDPVTRQWITDNPWITGLHLGANETKYFLYYALTPDAPGTYLLKTDVGYIENGDFQSYGTIDDQIVVGNDAAALTDQIITSLKALQVSFRDKAELCKAIRYMEMVKQRDRVCSTKKACQENIGNILEAIEEVMEINSCDTTPVRLMMDMLMQVYQGKYYFRY